MDDAKYMQRALELALRARGNTSPNPMVGAVVVAPNGSVVGEGYHERAGASHAESIALAAAGDRARGATLYVTLEPCDHDGATPPCTQAIVDAGIARVVAAMVDVDPRVSGRGIARLREAGIAVDVGVGEAAAAALNRAYVHHRKNLRPFVALKMAASLDGAISPRPGARHRLTGAKAAAFVHQLRYEYDAVMVGAHTAVTDDPELTVRPTRPRAVPYLRIVVDSRGKIPLDLHLVRETRTAPTLIATTSAMPADRREALGELGVEVVTCRATATGFVDLEDLLSELGRRNVLSVLCEGGPTLATSLLAGKLVGRVYWLMSPEILGSARVAPAIDGVAGGTRLEVESATMLGDDVLIEALSVQHSARQPDAESTV